MGTTHRTTTRGRSGPAAPTRHRAVPTRLHVPTERADLRVTWHEHEREFVLSLWHGDDCVGTAPLPPAEAAKVAAFVVTRLGAQAG